MKKIIAFILVVCSLITCTLTCYADKIYYTTRDVKIEDIIERLNVDSSISLKGNSKEYSFDYMFSFNENVLLEQKEATYSFLSKVIELGRGAQDNYYLSGGYDGHNNVAVCEITISGLDKYTFTLIDNHTSFWFGGYDIDSPDKLMYYLAVGSLEELSILDTEASAEKTCDEICEINIADGIISSAKGKEQALKEVERVEFDIITDDSYSGTLFEDISNIGSKIHCTIKNFLAGHTIYVLTLDGEKGTKQLFYQNYDWAFNPGDKLQFLTGHYIDEGKLIIDNNIKYDSIILEGISSNDNITEIKLFLKPDTMPFIINSTNLITAENIEYTALDTNERRSLNTLFGIPDKQTVIENSKEDKEKYDVEEQDPERYTTLVKGVRKDGRVLDYSISFIAEIPLNTDNNNNLPAWYSRLGNNVTATLIGFTQTIDGEENRNYTMIRFSGTKGNAWFNNADTIPMKTEDDTIIVDNSYVSLVSFDGKERVYNSVTHETLDTKITFSNDDNMDLLNIAIKIGNKTISVDSSDVKYIGGGKATYEKLW